MNFSPLSAFQIVWLHLLPGAAALVAFPLIRMVGETAFSLPAAYAYFIVIAFVLVPIELGYLVYQKRTRGVKFRDVILYKEPLALRQYVLLASVLILWSAVVMSVIAPPISRVLFSGVFADGNWFFYGAEHYASSLSGWFLAVTLFLDVLLAGLIVPVVHELYFRGHLLPRMSHLGHAAYVTNALLFALSRFFYAPWYTPARFLLFLPIAYVAWRKKNVALAVATHLAIDIYGVLWKFF